MFIVSIASQIALRPCAPYTVGFVPSFKMGLDSELAAGPKDVYKSWVFLMYSDVFCSHGGLGRGFV